MSLIPVTSSQAKVGVVGRGSRAIHESQPAPGRSRAPTFLGFMPLPPRLSKGVSTAARAPGPGIVVGRPLGRLRGHTVSWAWGLRLHTARRQLPLGCFVMV